jgi:hypothetical protein
MKAKAKKIKTKIKQVNRREEKEKDGNLKGNRKTPHRK